MINKLKKIILKEDNFIYKKFFAPVNNINKSTYQCAIYIDNEDYSSMLQLEKWFENNFFSKNEILIIVRLYSSSSKKVLHYLQENNYNFYGYKVIRTLNIDNFSIKYIFYLFNSFTNPVMIKNRDQQHIWIAHGESDKLASVNPMIRMYDFIFTSGDIAINRFLHYKIINECDVKNKIIRVGTPYLKKPTLDKKPNKKMKILYAPTWEGVETKQQYSSLDNDFALNTINSIVDKYKNADLYFMPHPSTGIKNKKYINYCKNLILENIQNKSFYVAQSKNSYIYTHISNLIHTDRYIKEFTNFEDFDLVITDISSIIANLIYYNVNYIVLVKNLIVKSHLSDDIKKDMPLLSLSSIVYENQLEKLLSVVNKELLIDKQGRFDKLISYESAKEDEQSLEYYINIMRNK